MIDARGGCAVDWISHQFLAARDIRGDLKSGRIARSTLQEDGKRIRHYESFEDQGTNTATDLEITEWNKTKNLSLSLKHR